MSRSLTRSQATLLGIVVLIGVVLAGVGVFAIGSRHWPWNNVFTLQVGFPQARGVAVGTRVRVQGVDAGQVAEVRRPDKPGGKVLLALQLGDPWRRDQLIRADASAQIVSEGMVGAKVVEIDPGTATAEPIGDNAMIADKPTVDLADALDQAAKVMQLLDAEKNKVAEVVENANSVLRQGGKTMASIQKSADALQRLPVLRNYVLDPGDALYRPDSDCTPVWLAAEDLFAPDRAQLTVSGKQRLDALIGQLTGLTGRAGAELVVVAYVDPKEMPEAERAKKLTQTRSGAVLDYLSDHGAVRKKYWVLPAKKRALGLGHDKGPLPGQLHLPAVRRWHPGVCAPERLVGP